jgi:hypothetical protein
MLERHVFQQIMMETGLQKLEDQIKFLRSVPLCSTLPDEILIRLSDALEVVSTQAMLIPDLVVLGIMYQSLRIIQDVRFDVFNRCCVFAF